MDERVLDDDFQITVPDRNLRPLIDSPAAQTLTRASIDIYGTVIVDDFGVDDTSPRTVAFQLTAKDADSPQGELTFSGANVSPTGYFSVVITEQDAVHTKNYPVTVTDTGGLSSTLDIRIQIGDERQFFVDAPIAVPKGPKKTHRPTSEDEKIKMNWEGLQSPYHEFDSSISVNPIEPPAIGSLQYSAGEYVYTPDSTWQGPGIVPLSLTLRQHAYNGTQLVSIDSNAALVELFITNDRPTAGDVGSGQYSTTAGVTLNANTTSGLAQFTSSDSEEDARKYSLKLQAAHGVVTVNPDGSFSYDPDESGFHGKDSFVYRVIDVDANGHEMEFYPDARWDSETTFYDNGQLYGLVIIDVTPSTNAVPEAVDDYYTVAAAAMHTESAPGVLGNDSDSNGPLALTAHLVGNNPQGAQSFTLNANGSFSYQPKVNFSGVDSFTYKAFDGQFSSTATVYITVLGDSLPVATPDTYNVYNYDQLHVLAPGVLGNDSDSDGQTLTAEIVSGPGHEALDSFEFYADGSFKYKSEANYTENDSFTYRVSDGIGWSQPTTVTLVRINNYPPDAQDDGDFVVERAVSEVLTIADATLLANDIDDGNLQPLQATIETYPQHGTLTHNAITQQFVYTYTGTGQTYDSFTYRAYDGQYWDIATVYIEIVNPYSDPTGLDETPIECGCGCGCGDFEFHAQKQTGALTGTIEAGDLLLHYDTGSNPHPTLVLNTDLHDGTHPDLVEAQVSFGGAASQSIFFSNSGLGAGDDQLRFALPVDATNLKSGTYGYSFVLKNTYGTRVVDQTFSGTVNIVNRTESEFGNRWSLAGLDRLYLKPDGAMLATGDGNAFWFSGNATTGYTRPVGEPGFSTLVRNPIGTYTLTSKDGYKSHFNIHGVLTTRTDPNGNVTIYNYEDKDLDGVDDEIVGITDPFNRTTSFVYSGARVQTITDFAGRVTVLSYANNTLTGITKADPDAAGQGLAAPANTFSYDTATKLMKTWMNATGEQVAYNYDEAQRLTSIEEGHGTASITSAQSFGWINTSATGNPGTLANPAILVHRSANPETGS